MRTGAASTRERRCRSGREVMDELELHLQELKKKVQIGIEQIANGDYVEYTSETLHELFDDVEREGLKRLEARRKESE